MAPALPPGADEPGGEPPPIPRIIIHIIPPIISSIIGTMTSNQPMPPSCMPHLSAGE